MVFEILFDIDKLFRVLVVCLGRHVRVVSVLLAESVAANLPHRYTF